MELLAVDSRGEHPSGACTHWTAPLEVDCRRASDDSGWVLNAGPKTEIRYTLDGSNPRVEADCRAVLRVMRAIVNA